MQVNITTKSVLAVAISLAFLTGCWDDPRWAAAKVSQAINQQDVVGHLQSLEGLASPTSDNSSVTRAAGTTGYENSVDYIVSTMKSLGYRVSTQDFDFRAWEELSGTSLNVDGQALKSTREAEDGEEPDYAVMSYSGNSNGAMSGNLAFVTPDFDFSSPDYDATDGCEASDFDQVDVTGKIAVIQRGSCSFNDKVYHAQQAGAVGAIVFNQGNNDGRTAVVNGTLGSDSPVTIPAFGVRYALGKQWYDKLAQNSGPIDVSLAVSVKDEMVVTQNIIAETKGGNPHQVVMLGAHLDSVPEGPGINDNGSGTAGLLEFATRLSELHVPVKNRVRFAWWAAEESGLVGSNHYANELFAPLYDKAQAEIMKKLGIEDPSQLTEEQVEMVEDRYGELNKVKLYLNFDMIGSPNYIYGVMDGDLSDTKDSPDNAYTGDFTPPHGTSDIESIFNEFFTAKSEKTVPQALSKRSDYAGFADWGVAFGGLFTGAEQTKSVEEADWFGGHSGEPYDKCYHQACDDLNNISQQALFVNTQALAYVTTYYAMSRPLFPAEEAEPAPMVKSLSAKPGAKHRIGTPIKAAESQSDHGHFHGDFDQDRH